MKHLSTQFTDKITIDNYGEVWHIDHICPLDQAVTFDEVVKLCHYNNLRPMLATLNQKKHKNKTPEAELMCIKLLNRSWI